MNEVIHWSDWSSQPEIRIACTGKHHFPWTMRKDLPVGVYEAPKDSILYSFSDNNVNCEKCLNMLLDSVFNRFDRLMTAGRFDLVDDTILLIDFASMSNILVIGYLSITLCAKEKLKNRQNMLIKAEEKLRKTMSADEVTKILSGLG